MNNASEMDLFCQEQGKLICDLYGLNDMPEDQALELGVTVAEAFAEAVARTAHNISGRFSSRFPQIDGMVAIYAELGLKPRIELPSPWFLWVEACRSGDDLLAMRLITDGFNPDRRERGFHSAGNYLKKNKEALPHAWSWFCQRKLDKLAANTRKGDKSIEPAMQRAM